MNQITGYLDGSNIYGSRFDTARNLRFFRGGEMRAQNVRGRTYLPANPNECTDRTNTLACFEAGKCQNCKNIYILLNLLRAFLSFKNGFKFIWNIRIISVSQSENANSIITG